MNTTLVHFTPLPGIVRGELLSPFSLERAKALGFELVLNEMDKPDKSQWAEWLAEAEWLMTSWGVPRLDDDVLKHNSKLKIVGHAAGSVANLVSEDLYARGVRVVSANAIMARSVAEWCLWATLTASRSVLDYAKFSEASAPRREYSQSVRGIADCTVGIWGFGDVAREFLSMLSPLRPKQILVCDDYLTAEDAERYGVCKSDFATLLAESDILHTITSLTLESKGRVDHEALQSMKPRATIINAGRAPLIDRDALLNALQTRDLRAILDVHYREPVPQDDAFVALSNVIMTPHCAGRGSRGHYVACVLEEFDRFRKGEPLRYEISQERAARMTDSSLLR